MHAGRCRRRQPLHSPPLPPAQKQCTHLTPAAPAQDASGTNYTDSERRQIAMRLHAETKQHGDIVRIQQKDVPGADPRPDPPPLPQPPRRRTTSLHARAPSAARGWAAHPRACLHELRTPVLSEGGATALHSHSLACPPGHACAATPHPTAGSTTWKILRMFEAATRSIDAEWFVKARPARPFLRFLRLSLSCESAWCSAPSPRL